MEVERLRQRYDAVLSTTKQVVEPSFVFGYGKVLESYREAVASLGLGLSSDDEAKFDEAKKTFEAAMLFCYVSFMEHMIKDYAILTGECSNWDPDLWKWSNQELSLMKTINRQGAVKGLSKSSWQHRVRMMAQEALTKSGKSSNLSVHVERRIGDFPHWRVLLRAKIIRDLQAHSNGEMSAQEYKHNPLCAIGKKPSWDRSLLEATYSALHMLNSGLADLLLKENQR